MKKLYVARIQPRQKDIVLKLFLKMQSVTSAFADAMEAQKLRPGEGKFPSSLEMFACSAK